MEVIELDGQFIYIRNSTVFFWINDHVKLQGHMEPGKMLVFSYVSSDHPYFVGVQYHPEFTSRPIKPSPPYFGLLLAASGKLQGYLQKNCRLSPR